MSVILYRGMVLGQTLTLIVLLLALSPFSVETADKAPTAQSRPISTDIRLFLTTEKKIWKQGEVNSVTAYLENVSQNVYYVGNYIQGLRYIIGPHYIILTITDQRGRDLVTGGFSVTTLRKRGEPLVKNIEEHYIKLMPGNIHGVTERDHFNLKPGRYTLKAEYYEQISEEEANALPFPVWTKTLESNKVKIRVVREY